MLAPFAISGGANPAYDCVEIFICACTDAVNLCA